jgi:hypothetical protein
MEGQMRLRSLFTLSLLLTLCACGPLMLRSQRYTAPLEGGALVTFLQPFEVGKDAAFDLWDGDRYLGKLSKGTLIDLQVEAGEHFFMAKASNWSVIKAKLAPGKRYYVVARPAVNAAEIAVVLEPATLEDEASELTKWLSRLTPVSVEPEKALLYATHHANEARAIRRKAKAGEIYVRVLE